MQLSLRAVCVKLHKETESAFTAHSFISEQLLFILVAFEPVSFELFRVREELHVELSASEYTELLFELHTGDCVGNGVMHVQPISTEHCREHPSLSKMLPSSQLSEGSIKLFPHSDK